MRSTRRPTSDERWHGGQRKAPLWKRALLRWADAMEDFDPIEWDAMRGEK